MTDGLRRIAVVVGGGVAGISCIESLFQEIRQDRSNQPILSRIVLISESRIIKQVTNYSVRGRRLENFDITSAEADELQSNTPNCVEFSIIQGIVKFVDYDAKTVEYCQFSDGRIERNKLEFDVLCFCQGSRPKRLNYRNRKPEIDDKILQIRDLSSVVYLQNQLSLCKRVAFIGNGGISLELVGKISRCHKTWIIKDRYIGCPYFDSGAAKFLLDLASADGDVQSLSNTSPRSSYTASKLRSHPGQTFGPSLGPDWCHGELKGIPSQRGKLDIVYDDEVQDIFMNEQAESYLKIQTKNGIELDCDMIVSAIGVESNKIAVTGGYLDVSAKDGSIIIDEEMRTSLENVYAAGDCVSCEKWKESETWFQMHLWTQARQMGDYMGKCIVCHIRNEDPSIHFNFECFTHCTRFFGMKLVLLGRYNIEREEGDQLDVVVRVNPGKDYVKVTLRDGRVLGAVLIGDSGLEETLENLIYDRIDVSPFKDQLLDNTIDIEDFFD